MPSLRPDGRSFVYTALPPQPRRPRRTRRPALARPRLGAMLSPVCLAGDVDLLVPPSGRRTAPARLPPQRRRQASRSQCCPSPAGDERVLASRAASRSSRSVSPRTARASTTSRSARPARSLVSVESRTGEQTDVAQLSRRPHARLGALARRRPPRLPRDELTPDAISSRAFVSTSRPATLTAVTSPHGDAFGPVWSTDGSRWSAASAPTARRTLVRVAGDGDHHPARPGRGFDVPLASPAMAAPTSSAASSGASATAPGAASPHPDRRGRRTPHHRFRRGDLPWLDVPLDATLPRPGPALEHLVLLLVTAVAGSA